MAFLRVEGGNQVGRTYELTGVEMHIGRHEICEIVLQSIPVSRRHARIVRSDGKYVLEDMKSGGGTMLNGKRILGPSELRDGDLIKLADTVVSYHEASVQD